MTKANLLWVYECRSEIADTLKYEATFWWDLANFDHAQSGVREVCRVPGVNQISLNYTITWTCSSRCTRCDTGAVSFKGWTISSKENEFQWKLFTCSGNFLFFVNIKMKKMKNNAVSSRKKFHSSPLHWGDWYLKTYCNYKRLGLTKLIRLNENYEIWS